MPYFYLGLALISLTSFLYVNCTQNNVSLLLIRMMGYGSMYYHKMCELMRSNNVTISDVIIDDTSQKDINLAENAPAFHHLQIKYVQAGKPYRMVYLNNETIHFPVYTTSELEVKKAFAETSDNIILMTVKNVTTNEDISVPEDSLSIVREFSGPKGNFYEKKIPNYKSKIKPTLLKELGVPQDQTISIQILYSNGDSCEF